MDKQGEKPQNSCGFPDLSGYRWIGHLAERQGFEPWIRSPVCRISSAVHSTTLPPLREVSVGSRQVPSRSRKRAVSAWVSGLAKGKGEDCETPQRINRAESCEPRLFAGADDLYSNVWIERVSFRLRPVDRSFRLPPSPERAFRLAKSCATNSSISAASSSISIRSLPIAKNGTNRFPEEIRPPREQPFYHLLAENDESSYVAYVSQQNLLADAEAGPVDHPSVDEMFEAFPQRPLQAAPQPFALGLGAGPLLQALSFQPDWTHIIDGHPQHQIEHAKPDRAVQHRHHWYRRYRWRQESRSGSLKSHRISG